MKAITTQNVTKKYEDILAVNRISFDVDQGELFGLIGPDGAGKTTVFRILTTLLLPNEGSATVMGNDVVKEYQAIRNQVGYMPGKFSLYQDLTVEENLHFFATLFGTSVEENYELIKEIYVQIEPFKKRKAGKLSGGMKQKLALSCALIHKPTVLFLDEPTTGVDAVSRREFWEMLQRLKQKGITILVSTPYMDEAILCERIALMQHGEIMQIDTPQNIIDSFPKVLFAVRGENNYLIKEKLLQWNEVESCYSFGDHLHVTFQSDQNEIDLKSLLLKNLNQEIEIHKIQPTIEDAFIRLTEKYVSYVQ